MIYQTLSPGGVDWLPPLILLRVRCLAGHVLRRLDLSNMAHCPPPIPGKSRVYFKAISLFPKHVGAVLITCPCIGYMQADHS